MLANFPNPFTWQTTIPFVLPAACNASLRVYDVTGRVLAVVKGHYASGPHQVLFDFNGIDVHGVLFYDLTTPFGVETRKMVR
ncbi:MAG: T9SS type A sorting domain-containing protein [Saprospiraceae bacterium]